MPPTWRGRGIRCIPSVSRETSASAESTLAGVSRLNNSAHGGAMATQEQTERMSITQGRTEMRIQLAPTPAPVASDRRSLLAALGSGALLWLCYFPVAFGFLAWVALVPLLALLRCRARSRTVYVTAYVAGLLY